MEIGGDEEGNWTDPQLPVEQSRHPDPVVVMKRYWKSLVFWTGLVFVLVLVAILTPLFVLREEEMDENDRTAESVLADASRELEKIIPLVFVPAGSVGFWATGKTSFIEQMGSEVPVVEFHGGGKMTAPFERAAQNALRLEALQVGEGVVEHVQLSPHGVISALFPLTEFDQVRQLGFNLLTEMISRKEALSILFSENFAIGGGPKIGFTAALPVFYETDNCSCSSHTPFSSVTNHVISQVGELPDLPEGRLLKNASFSESFEYKKFDDLVVEGAPLTLTGVVIPREDYRLATMFCDSSYEQGLMGLELEDFGIQELQTADFLSECRFFWGFASVSFNAAHLTRSVVENIESAGLSYSLAKVEPNGEHSIISKSADFDRTSSRKTGEILLPGQTWSLEVTINDDKSKAGWKWQLAIAILGAIFLALLAFLVVFLIVYRSQYFKNVSTEFSQFSSDAMAQLNRAAANEKVAIQKEAVAKKFLSTMSHELRTPLNSIMAVSELMMLETGGSGEKDPFLRDCELIHDSAVFLKQIVDDILDFNKIEMGCLVLTPTTFSPVRAVQAVYRLAKPLIKDPNLFFILRVDPDTPNKAKADEHRFKQIIMNLASNAIKFIKAGGLTISLSAVSLAGLDRPKRIPSVSIISGASIPLQDSLGFPSSPPMVPSSQSAPISYENEWEERLKDCPKDRLQEIAKAHEGLFVFVDVEDTGPGMTQEQKKAVFKPFFQNDPSKDAKAGGSGLGLSICSDLCKHMGGVIWATDPLGSQGTSFRFLIPLLEAEGKVSPEVIDALSSVALDLNIDKKSSSVRRTPQDKQRGEEAFVAEEGELVHHCESSDFGNRDLFRVMTLENWDFSIVGDEKKNEEQSEAGVDSPRAEQKKDPNLSDASLADDWPLNERDPASPSSSFLPSPPILKVLVMDDSALNRLVFERLIKSLLSCSVDHAKSGEEGIQLAGSSDQRYDLVVCDLNMGEGKTGLEVGEELREQLNYPFVLALFTADVMGELMENGPFQAVLYKPLSRELLVQFIVEHLDPKFFPNRFPPVQQTKGRKKEAEKMGEKE